MWSWYKDSEIASDYVSTLLRGLHPSSEHLLIDVGGRTLAPELYWSSTAYHDHGTFTRKCRWSICRQKTGSHHTMQNFCRSSGALDCYPPSRVSTVSTTFYGVSTIKHGYSEPASSLYQWLIQNLNVGHRSAYDDIYAILDRHREEEQPPKKKNNPLLRKKLKWTTRVSHHNSQVATTTHWTLPRTSVDPTSGPFQTIGCL